MTSEPIFRADTATERVLRDAVIPGLAGLFTTLPAAPPDGVDEQVWAYAHGFYCRVARTCEAILLLVDGGRATECAPLRRAALEHVLAIAWVIDEGQAALAALGRAHQHRMKSIRDMLSPDWEIKPTDFEPLLGIDIQTQARTTSSDSVSWSSATSSQATCWWRG